MRSAIVTNLPVAHLASTPATARPVVRHSQQPAVVSFHALGTAVSVLLTAPAWREKAGAILRAELAAVDVACSRFRADSELFRLNNAGGREIAISRRLAGALAAALAAARATDGDVDPTCGRALIGLGYDRDFAKIPRDGTVPLRAGRLRITVTPAAGWRAVELDERRGTARLPAGVALDLGATAKALAADQAAERIAAAVGGGVLVNLGGDIRAVGPPPDGGWRIGIVDELAPHQSPDTAPQAQAVVITDGGLATSGTTARAWRRGGIGLHHIIEPATGLPAQTCWQSVSVAAASCLDANIASTAAVIRGERAVTWLSELRLPARLVRHNGSVLALAGWPADSQPGAGRGQAAGNGWAGGPV
jgi:thiamine biosynthesis lipoprotein